MADEQQPEREASRQLVQRSFEAALHSDKMAAEIGVFCLKILMTITAGGIVALLALVANLDKDKDAAMYGAALYASAWFLAGLIFAILSSGTAFLYQSFVTLVRRHNLDVASAVEKPKYSWARWGAGILKLPMVGFALLAFVAFVVGSVGFLYGIT